MYCFLSFFHIIKITQYGYLKDKTDLKPNRLNVGTYTSLRNFFSSDHTQAIGSHRPNLILNLWGGKGVTINTCAWRERLSDDDATEWSSMVSLPVPDGRLGTFSQISPSSVKYVKSIRMSHSLIPWNDNQWHLGLTTPADNINVIARYIQ